MKVNEKKKKKMSRKPKMSKQIREEGKSAPWVVCDCLSRMHCFLMLCKPSNTLIMPQLQPSNFHFKICDIILARVTALQP